MKILYILLAILILLLMITIHEFGHYIAGKILGFKIDEFSIGFGPKLFSKKKKNGEVFSIRLLPLGGFCAFAGETDEEKILAPEKINKAPEVFELTADNAPQPQNNDMGEKTVNATQNAAAAENDSAPAAESEKGVKELKNFNDQPPWKRIIVLLAGGVFNILSAVIFSFIFIVAAGASTPTVTKVYDSVDDSVVCMLEKDDVVLEIDGKKIDFFHTVAKALDGKKEGDTVTVKVLREENGESKELDILVTLRKYDIGVELKEGEQYPVGMGISSSYSHASVGEAFIYCVPYTAELSWLILGTFGDLIVGKVPLTEVSGPIGTVNQMANLGMQSWAYFLLLLPLIAANLGIFNLFPIPALDGAKVVFTLIEWIRGKPISQKVEGMIHFIGLIVLFGFVIILDIVNLILGFV